jgi:hypothetical protein
MQGPVLAELNHFIHKGTDSARADQGGLHTTMPNNLCGESAEKRLALVGGPTEFGDPLAV